MPDDDIITPPPPPAPEAEAPPAPAEPEKPKVKGMKILIVSDAWHPQVNGVVRTLENTVRELKALNHKVEVIGPEKSLFSIPAPTYPEIRLEFFAEKRLKAALDKFRPDVIHISTEGPLGMAMRRICLKEKRPFSTAYHTCFPEYIERRVPKFFAKTAKMLTYQFMKSFHAPSGSVMVSTPTIEALLRKHRITRLKRWSRGVDVSVFHPYPKQKELEDYRDLKHPLFLYVGRVAVEKNLEVFLNADLPGTKVIIGDGPDENMFKKKYPAVAFLGKKSGEELARHYAAADVFVFPSKTDTFGLVLLEALACGIPVASYPVQGPRDVLVEKEAEAVSVMKPDLREAALAALALEAKASDCHAFVLSRYTWGACTKQFLDNLQGTTPFNVRRLGRFSASMDFLQMIWRRIRTLPKFYPTFYRALSFILEPVLPLYLQLRMKKGKEDAARVKERFGETTKQRPLGKLIWCHGASVGESLSLLPLLEKLEAHPAKPSILLTTGTRSSAEVLQKRLPPNIIHQYVPIDTMKATERFMAHWHPDFAIITESELWPNLIGKIRKYAIPSALINARISKKSARKWGKYAGLWIAAILRVFRLVLAQSKDDALRFQKLGVPGAKSVGNLKATAPMLPVVEADYDDLKNRIADRPVWLMASTHEGEDELALQIAATFEKAFPHLLTIIVPRHPERVNKIAELATAQKLNVIRRSEKTPLKAAHQVYIADTLGELGLFYKLAPVVCVAGSFTSVGGHNPVEPAAFGCAIIFGNDMRNFSEIAAAMVKDEAALQVKGKRFLAASVKKLLQDKTAREKMGVAAKAFHARQRAVLDRLMKELQPLLDEALK